LIPTLIHIHPSPATTLILSKPLSHPLFHSSLSPSAISFLLSLPIPLSISLPLSLSLSLCFSVCLYVSKSVVPRGCALAVAAWCSQPSLQRPASAVKGAGSWRRLLNSMLI